MNDTKVDLFRGLHNAYKSKFTKAIFYKFYRAMRDEIMKAELFRFSPNTWNQIIDVFRSKPDIECYWEVFDLAMNELLDFRVDLYFSMIRYLFNDIAVLDEDELDLYEFYALCEEEKEKAIWFKDDDPSNRLAFLLDDYFHSLDDWAEEYFNATEDDFYRFLDYCEKNDIEIPDVYARAIKVCIMNKNFQRAFVYIAKIIYMETGKAIVNKNGKKYLKGVGL